MSLRSHSSRFQLDGSTATGADETTSNAIHCNKLSKKISAKKIPCESPSQHVFDQVTDFDGHDLLSKLSSSSSVSQSQPFEPDARISNAAPMKIVREAQHQHDSDDEMVPLAAVLVKMVVMVVFFFVSYWLFGKYVCLAGIVVGSHTN
jgi:hypothetical protein